MSERRHEQQERRSPAPVPSRRDRRPSSASVASTTGASSYDTVPETEEYSMHSPAFEPSERKLPTSGTSPAPENNRAHQSRGHSRSQSVIETRSTNTRRRDKAAVGFACLNCKRAHLACDVARPCRRCIQMGRSSTCTDVPHKRRGRPRLRDSQQLPSIPADLSSPPQSSEAGPSSTSSGRHRRGHSRTGSMNSPYMDFYPSPTRPAWSPNSSRRPLAPASRHNRSPSLVNASIPGPQHPPPWQMPPHEPPRSSSATLFVSVDLTIIRALPDANNFFSATSSQIQGRALIQLCHQNDKRQIPRLTHALQTDVQTNRLMFRAHDHRQSLAHDLEPYTDADLSHPFPGAQEHLLSLAFVDALGRHIPARMAAVLGSRSNDRFAYVIISIQRQEQQHVAPATPRSLASAPSQSPRAYEPGGFPAPQQTDYNARSLPTSNPIQLSPTYASRPHPQQQLSQQQTQQNYARLTSAPRPSSSTTQLNHLNANLNTHPANTTTANPTTTTTTTTTNRGPHLPALNVLPPLQTITQSAPVAIPTSSPRQLVNMPTTTTTTTMEGAEPGSQSSDTSSRRSSKRISMSLSDIID